MAKQIRFRAQRAAWPDTPGGLILGTSVYVTAGLRDDDDKPLRMPFGLINLGTQTPDPEDPDLLTQEFILVIACEVLGDPLGEHSMIGGPSSAGATNRLGQSQGRGLLDLETALLTSLGKLTGADGTPVIVSHGSSPAPERLDKNVHVVHRQYILTALCTRADEYLAPTDLTIDVTTPGQATLAWVLPPSAYGLRKIILRRASGSTAPSSSTAGTGVTLASDLATSVTVSGLSAGAHSFALFAAFSESGAAVDERFSVQTKARDKGSYRTGTVT